MKTFYIREAATGKKVERAEDVYESIREIGKADQETLRVIGYNGSNTEIYRECIFMGGMNHSMVDLKILFKRLITHDCLSFVIAHNHPSDNCTASDQDKTLTRAVELAALTLDIKFLDHLIICESNYLSFRNQGLM